MTKRARLQLQVDELSFLCKVAGVSLITKADSSYPIAETQFMRHSDICGELGVELLILRFERSQLRWFWHLIRMPPWCILCKSLWGMTNWEETVEQIPQNPLKKSWKTSLFQDFWNTLLKQLQPDPRQVEDNGWMDGWMEVGSFQMGRQYIPTFNNRCFGTTNCFANMSDLTLPELFRKIKL